MNDNDNKWIGTVFQMKIPTGKPFISSAFHPQSKRFIFHDRHATKDEAVSGAVVCALESNGDELEPDSPDTIDGFGQAAKIWSES